MMRVSVKALLGLAVVLVVMAGDGGGVVGQLSFSPGGLSTPPINVLAVFRLLREVLSTVLFPPPTPKVESICIEEDESEGCLTWETYEVEAEDHEDASGSEVLEKLGTTQMLVGKWPLVYVIFIIVTSIILIIVAVPYVITGEPYTRRSLHPHPDHGPLGMEDTALILSWVLSEAGGSEDCLHRLVCDLPDRSGRYLHYATSILHFIPRSWVPMQYEDQLQRLDLARDEGYSYQCHKYHCPALTQ